MAEVELKFELPPGSASANRAGCPRFPRREPSRRQLIRNVFRHARRRPRAARGWRCACGARRALDPVPQGGAKRRRRPALARGMGSRASRRFDRPVALRANAARRPSRAKAAPDRWARDLHASSSRAPTWSSRSRRARASRWRSTRAGCGNAMPASEISEVEIESIEGEPLAVFDFAERLVDAAPLRPSSVTKAQRGYRLFAARPLRAGEGRANRLDADMTPELAARATVASALGQLQANEVGVLATRGRSTCTRRASRCGGCARRCAPVSRDLCGRARSAGPRGLAVDHPDHRQGARPGCVRDRHVTRVAARPRGHEAARERSRRALVRAAAAREAMRALRFARRATRAWCSPSRAGSPSRSRRRGPAEEPRRLRRARDPQAPPQAAAEAAPAARVMAPEPSATACASARSGCATSWRDSPPSFAGNRSPHTSPRFPNCRTTWARPTTRRSRPHGCWTSSSAPAAACAELRARRGSRAEAQASARPCRRLTWSAKRARAASDSGRSADVRDRRDRPQDPQERLQAPRAQAAPAPARAAVPAAREKGVSRSSCW